MNDYYPLSKISLGETGVIAYVNSDCQLRHRLWDLGFTRGTHVVKLFRSPFGNPTAYLIRGCVIALRNEDAACINIYSSYPKRVF